MARCGLLLLVALSLCGCAHHGPVPKGHDNSARAVSPEPARPTLSASSDPKPPPAPSATTIIDVAADVPPRRPGPCPAPTDASSRLFSNAWAIASGTSVAEPHHAIDEVLRIRLDQLYTSGCRGNLDDKQLVKELQRLSTDKKDPPALFAQSLHGWTMMGHSLDSGSGVAMYAYRGGKARTRIDVTNDGTSEEKTLLLLDAVLFQPPGAPEPLLLIANTHPWMSSCWRSLRVRALAPGPDPRTPAVLLDHRFSGRWCEGIRIRTDGADIHFLYDAWAAVFKQEMVRGYSLSFRYRDGALERRFGFESDLGYVVEDWLTEPWTLANQATVASERAKLASVHRNLAAVVAVALKQGGNDEPTFTREVFPIDATTKRVVVYCAGSSSGKPCPSWPKPVDFKFRAGADGWRLAEVRGR